MQIVFVKKYCINHNTIIAHCLIKTNPGIFKFVDNPKTTDIIGFTYFNNDSDILLKRLRNEYKNNKIIVGGIGVYQNYNYIFRYADMVYFGDAFIFNERSVVSKNSTKNKVIYNNTIPFDKLPFIQHTKNRYEFITEKGCPNKCEFCQISHVQEFSMIDNNYFQSIIKKFDCKYKKLTLSFLNSDGLINYRNAEFLNSLSNNKYYAASVPVKMYLKKYNIFGKQNNIKFGVELPSQELREKHLPALKRITDSELIETITEKSINIMTYFLIYNYIGVVNNDYSHLYNVIAKKKKNVNLRTSFTTLNISAYTPLSHKLGEHIHQLINSDNFTDVKEIQMYKNIAHVRVLPAKMNKNVLFDYFKTHLPIDIKIINPDKYETALCYYKAVCQVAGNNVIDIMQERINQMKMKNNEINLIR